MFIASERMASVDRVGPDGPEPPNQGIHVGNQDDIVSPEI